MISAGAAGVFSTVALTCSGPADKLSGAANQRPELRVEILQQLNLAVRSVLAVLRLILDKKKKLLDFP